MEPADEMKEMLQLLSNNGYRITEQRQKLLAILMEEQGFLSPKDVYARMLVDFPGVSFDTVYRNLRILHQLGMVEPFNFMENGVKFKISYSKNQHHHHLVCLACDKIVPFDYCPLDRPIHFPEKMKVMYHRFEVYGLCEYCQ
ncbi:ferric uptake regulator, Fur family [Paenibacillus algicola]|uniref:Ferric uptake regulator, Fur family n=1 Tax=Paenibacillus algicola TaxID=2565926 RepID=A0A4P8XL35_9BACL|nr:Fur family transcriptional regulator [Paenibacillus algicola]QCT03005.1 ferric uptake regulator, Fur family [Paenibacillus algicola]